MHNRSAQQKPEGIMGKKLYRRERYPEKIRPFYNDDNIIKVIM